MSCHYCHILKVALPSLITNRTVMRMIYHEPLDDACPERPGVGIIDRNAHPLCSRCHTGHDNFSLGVMLISELFYGTEPAGADRSKGRMPAEVGNIESQGEACIEEVLPFAHLKGLVVNIDGYHTYFQGHRRRRMCCWKSSL